MEENRSNLLLIEFDAGAMSFAELQAFHAVLLESMRYAPRFAQWMANEFLRPELERRQSGAEAPAKRYYPFPGDWADAEIGQALLVTTGIITGADFAPSAKPFLAQVAQQIAGIAASRLIEQK
jgi:hypothetical protein